MKTRITTLLFFLSFFVFGQMFNADIDLIKDILLKEFNKKRTQTNPIQLFDHSKHGNAIDSVLSQYTLLIDDALFTIPFTFEKINDAKKTTITVTYHYDLFAEKISDFLEHSCFQEILHHPKDYFLYIPTITESQIFPKYSITLLYNKEVKTVRIDCPDLYFDESNFLD